MQIYLPIAELSVDIFLLLAMGGAVGFLSGMFGVGGGFLMTPLLMFVGVPPGVAVGTAAQQLVAGSVSGLLAHWRRGNVDFTLGLVLSIGGLVGTAIGMVIFERLRATGQVQVVISLGYVLFLGLVGGIMVVEAAGALLGRELRAGRRKAHVHRWVHGLPFKLRFRKSRLYASALLPMGMGVLVGILSSVLGVGGGFVLVPAMIYLLGVPTQVVVGTSLLQITVVTAAVTFLHAVVTGTVDMVLALVLLAGSVVGAQLGTRFGVRLRGEQLRGLLGLLVLIVALRLAFDLVMPPTEPFSLVLAGEE